jgi:ribonucleoside-diphosphate reductase alpha chain
MRVVKRNGDSEDVSFDKVLNRIKNLSNGLEIDPVAIAQKVCSRIYDGVHTYELDDLAAQICSSLIVDHPDYDTLATRITVSNHHKRTSPSFSETVQILYDNYNEEGTHTPLVSKKIHDLTMSHKEKLNTYIQYDRDYKFNYFGFKTLEKSYLFRKNGVVIERPQHLLMRVALGIHEDDFKDALETYDAMSTKKFIHATPTLFNSGTPHPQMSSCFLAEVSDSIDGIFKSMHECAHISKYAGGIGLHIHKVRGKDSIIRGTNGHSSGIVPMLRVFNATARYVNQCFVPETVIYTDMGVKTIKDVCAEDKVLTRDGTYQRVIHTVKTHVKKTILKIATKYAIEPVCCTPEHQVYALVGQRKGVNYNIIKTRLEKNLIKPEYVSASELTEDDMLGYPISSFTTSSTSMEDDPYMIVYGAVIRSSQPTMYQAMESNHSIQCNMPLSSPITDRIKNALDKLLITHKIVGDKLVWDVCGERFPLQDLPFAPGGLSMETMTKQQITSFVDGAFVHNQRVIACSAAMVHTIRRLCMQLGLVVNTTIVTRFLNDIKTYEMTLIRSTVKKNLSLFHDGMLWTRIQSIREVPYEGDVYDLNVHDNHNYTTDMGLVHNSGRRNGSIAMYLEPWHPDVFQFLEMKKNHGAEEQRARDLFYALWIPDLFMERVEKNGVWSLMCPDLCKDLCELYGDEFKQRYEAYEAQGKIVRQVKAQDIWFKIMESQIETGTPYMLYKDAVNKKSNQKNLGTIKSSNLCVAGDTHILTDEGYKRIESIEGRFVNVWNGFEWSHVKVSRTSNRSKLIRVKFSNGRSIKCTPYHKFFVEDPNTRQEIVKQAYELCLGMKLSYFNVPVVQQFKERVRDFKTPPLSCYDRYFESKKEAYTHAFICAKNSSASWLVNENRIILKQNEQNSMKRLQFSYAFHMVNQSTCVTVRIHPETRKYLQGNAPTNASLDARLEWLAGYIDAVGYIQKDNLLSVLTIDVSRKMMDSLYLMLCTMGTRPTCQVNEGKIVLCDEDVERLVMQGLKCEVVDMTDMLYGRLQAYANIAVNDCVRIVGVEDNNEYEPTFCFTEKKRHRGMFDGVVIGNCTEIMEYTDENETAVCNLASMCLPSYVNTDTKQYDFETLHRHVKIVVKNLNKIIDKNFYPVKKAEVSNMRHRPIGIGVQGLADAYLLMGFPFDSQEAALLNRDIFETMYHAALEESMEISKRRHEIITEHNQIHVAGTVSTDDTSSPWNTYVRINEYERDAHIESSKYPGAYTTFDGSPASEGILQFDMWGVEVGNDRYDWTRLKDMIRTYGLRNSLLLAPMPTASTSQIMGFNEAFEPFTSNLYKRKTIAGEFIVINQYLIRDLISLGIWNKSLKEKLLLEDGSIQNIKEIPQAIRDLYKVVWDIKQRVLIDQSADRGAFICQSQSMNLFSDDPSFSKLTSMYFYAWRKGLKTGLYYLRTKPKSAAQQFTIDPKTKSKWLGTREEDESTCVSCSA